MDKNIKYLISAVKIQNKDRPEIKSIVLFGLNSADGDTVYLEIRYIDYEQDLIEGDHLMLSLEDAYENSFKDYGIKKSDWRKLTSQEIEHIDKQIR